MNQFNWNGHQMRKGQHLRDECMDFGSPRLPVVVPQSAQSAKETETLEFQLSYTASL